MLTEEQKKIHYGSPEHNNNELYLSKLRYSKPLEYKDIYTGKDVLDVGIGWAGGTKHIARMAKSLIGIDANEETLKLAIESYKLDNSEYFLKYSYDIDYINKFDTIIFVECYEHMDYDELQLTLQKLYDALKPNGYLWISTPELRGNKKDFPKGSHFMEYTFEEVKSLVESYGFKLEKYWKIFDSTSNGFLFIK